ncbi:type I-B CRISPR-associated protein Cas7/Csh2 [Petrimonas mucosa]|jgi:CRISPR-associated protein Csh2|uniref:CRISPR-associated protein Cas7 n=1 Tax=Petrimonas mucosa TaxID=1642646 RepID=A0A1G4G546_9BACT|nr:type I-B CRISPR-associated protein Cas7/Csh2 [Petrimonas mucosa]SCM56325.1 CRISPR-associated protein Cas7 {ECO:0000303/PubMed:24459147} [Petrimonas mucosa]
MSEIINSRSELLFLYDIENANPNGDPLNENRPRFDTEESVALVSDVRLKRTIRDYWYEYKEFNGLGDRQDIFVRETTYEEGDKQYIKDGKRRAKDFQEAEDIILNKCIDIRVFGGVIPLGNDSITYIGPVQFQMGKSLNKTGIIEEQGTGAFASSDKKAQATFRTEYKVPYAVIGFNGVINEKAARYSRMTKEDKSLLIEGIWEGTKNLISRSKFGQSPLFLLEVEYNEPFYIGNLRQRLKLDCGEKNELQIRGTNDYKLDVSELIEALKENKEKIADIHLKVDSRMTMISNGQLIKNISKDEL